jgi:hypothetical protein
MFKVGDKVKLTGYKWESLGADWDERGLYGRPNGAFKGNVVTIDTVDDEEAWFNGWYVEENEDDEYGCVLVESAEKSSFVVSDNGNSKVTDWQTGSLEAVVQNVHRMIENVINGDESNPVEEVHMYLEGAMDALGIPMIEDEED